MDISGTKKNCKFDHSEYLDIDGGKLLTKYIQWNLSIVVTIGANFFGCYRQVAALMR